MYKWTDGTDYLMHHGIKGQKWGVRRFQNEDGSYTAAGRERRHASQSNSDLDMRRSLEKYKAIDRYEKTVPIIFGIPYVLTMGAMGVGSAIGNPVLMMASLGGSFLAVGSIAIAERILKKKIEDIDRKYEEEATIAANNLQNKNDEFKKSSDYDEWKKRVTSFHDNDIPKQEKLTEAAKRLQKSFEAYHGAKEYYDKIGGNNIWNRMAAADGTMDRDYAIGISIIENSLRQNKDLKKLCTAEEADGVEAAILSTRELGYDFPGSISERDMKMVNEYLRRFG